MLENLNNYYMYYPIAKHEKMIIHTEEIDFTNWQEYYDGLLNIMKDGIELPEVHQCMITLIFPTKEDIDISIPDLFINLILWYPLVALKKTIEPQHLFLQDTFTNKDIKTYIDFHVIEPNRMIVSNKILNNVISDMVCKFIDVDNFALYLADTLNLEDDIVLMERCPEFNDLIHCDLSDVPIERIKDAGMDIVYKAIKIIMNSRDYLGYDHYLKNAFAAKEGINIRQYKENHYNIGTKPDGQGSIYHDFINQSYITGGLNNFLYQLIDSGSSRVAQIIAKKNVGESGGFSRILGLNNMDSFLHEDPEYDCGTKNFIYFFVANNNILERLKNRYYRIHPKGQDMLLSPKDTHLIGHHIYLRSPMTCASKAEGRGVCYKCYGNLAYTNASINIGRIGTELITSQYTQKRLSAKHLLETSIDVIVWNDGFRMFFSVDINTIKLVDNEKGYEGYKLIIDPEHIQLENDDEFFSSFSNAADIEDEGQSYNEYLTEFIVEDPLGNEIPIGSITTDNAPEAKMYFSSDLINIIRFVMKQNEQEDIEDDKLIIPFELLEDITLFFIKLQNNDLGKNLDIFKDLIDKRVVTKSHTKDTLLEKILEILIKGDITCQSVHVEVILSNQIRSIEDRLEMPNWRRENEPYELLTLNEALTDNPSVIISFLYQKLAKTLYYPLTFKKTTPCLFDILHMRKPKKFLEADHEIYDLKDASTIQKDECPMIFFKDHNGPRPKNLQEIVRKVRNVPKTDLDD